MDTLIIAVVMAALVVAVVWSIWDAVAESRNQREIRAQVIRNVNDAEYELHLRSSKAFQNMMDVARNQSQDEYQGLQDR